MNTLKYIKMDNEEILMRIKKHTIFFDSLEECIEDKEILHKAKIYMKLFFFELLKHNLKNEKKSKL